MYSTILSCRFTLLKLFEKKIGSTLYLHINAYSSIDNYFNISKVQLYTYKIKPL